MTELEGMPLRQLLEEGILGLGWVFTIYLLFVIMTMNKERIKGMTELLTKQCEASERASEAKILIAEQMRALTNLISVGR